MKKILAALVLFTVGHGAFPQSLKNVSSSGNSEVSTTVLDNSSVEKNTVPNAVSTKAIRNFKKLFKNVSDEKWYEMPDGYRVKFSKKDNQSSVSYKVDYDKEGNWMHTIRSYDEKELAKNIRDRVKTTYFDYSIILVDEVIMPLNQSTYVIHLEGATNWINVRIANGEMDELQKYNK